MTTTGDTRPRVGLFVTCLADLVRPSVAFAAVRLIEQAGCCVEVPTRQTCCGQPAYNTGASDDARSVARQAIEVFREFDYVVAPSGSCAAMLKLHYPKLFAGDHEMEAQANAFAAKVHELIAFLVNVRGQTKVGTRCASVATYHDACSGLRELAIKDEPRRLLGTVAGLELREMDECETCCGFGGLFSVKQPEISHAMAETKLASAAASGAGLMLSGDLGCLLHLAGTARRKGLPMEFRHVAEVLAGELDQPPIARGEDEG